MLAAPQLSDADRTSLLFTKAAYDATWQPQVQPPVPEAAAEENNTDAAKEWKFHAAQLTYNCTTGEWASHDHSVLNGLSRRMLAFAKELGKKLGFAHLSVKMEQSEADHVHVHIYFNTDKVFHRRGRDALELFVFEGNIAT